MQFAHLHAHDGGSLYDGFSTPEQRAQRAQKIGQTHLAVTNHGVMITNLQHYKECIKNGVVPIQGLEAYFMKEFQPGKEFTSLRRHLTLLAKTQEGYSNLCRLTTDANLNSFYIKPIITYELLERHSKDIICLSGCVLGEIPQMIIQNDFDAARRETERHLQIFGSNFFFEVQPQDFDDQKKANEGLIKLSQEFHRPIVMTNDAHYSDPDDLDTYILFRKMGRSVDDIKLDDIRKQYKNLYLCDGDTMAQRWQDLMGSDGSAYVIQSQTIAESIENVSLVFKEEVPKYIELDENGDAINPNKILALKTKAAMRKMGLWTKTYIDRAKEELRIITLKDGKSDYYLMVADLCDYARKNDVAIGPGRGSGVASLVAYVLGITQIDPVIFDLNFYRFMTEERVTIPDFDIDFSSKRYMLVVDYIITKYAGKAAQIANVLYYKGDNLVNDLGKALDMQADEIAFVKTTLKEMLLGDKKKPEFARLVYNKKLKGLNDAYRIIEHFCKIWGNPKALGQHASGVAITPGPISDYVPLLVRGKEGERRVNTSYDMEGLSYMNVVKIDVLRIDAIDIVKQCMDAIKIDTKDIPLDDPKVFENYCKINTTGIFQFDSYGGKEILRRIQPTNIQELMDATSLDRPGALQMDQTRVYIDGKAGSINEKSLLYPYCSKTYGALLYQEQIMMACRGIAGMSWGEASKVMKNLEALPATHPLTIRFVQGAREVSNLDADTAIELFHNLTSYTFNAGHASAYAVLSYWMMWLKTYHPRMFFLELLRASIEKKNIKDLEGDCINNSIPVFLPHVNGEVNYHLYEPYKDEYCIRSGILTIDNVGGVAAAAIARENKNGHFTSKDEFLDRMNKLGGRKVITSRVLTALEGAGALEFDFQTLRERAIHYNSALLSKATSRRKW